MVPALARRTISASPEVSGRLAFLPSAATRFHPSALGRSLSHSVTHRCGKMLLATILSLGYYLRVPKENGRANKAASLLGKRSAAARRKAWGAAEFKRRMQQWGKLGGRPRKKSQTKEKQ